MPRRGFTLIELLVVISIIALLSSISAAGLTAARAKSRDSRRLADLRTLQAAIEMYRNDFGSYPSTGGSWYGDLAACGASWGSRSRTGASGYIPNLAPNYISILPIDPKVTGNGCYLYRSDGTDFMLLAWTSVEGSTPVPIGVRRPNYQNEPTYAIYTQGASTW